MASVNNSPYSKSVNQSQGCPVPVGNSICGEANSLEIMKEFNRLYEDRMQQIDSEAGGDCLQEKMKLQQEWIRNLTQQNEMLVQAVQELEYEATDRVQQLEEKLHKSAQCLCEVMKKYREHDFTVDLLAEPLQKISHLEDDLRNLLEFIRRVRESGDWSIDGLFFYNISKEDLLETKCKFSYRLTKDESNEGEKLLEEKEKTIHDLTQKVNYYNTFGDLESMAQELKCRREECDSLKQALTDTRQALTEEVALKHDQVILLRKDIKTLEDRCLQADKQTAFKEDIIRELRKEIKQLKQQVTEKYLNLVADQLQTFFESHESSLTSGITDREMECCKKRICSLENENLSLKETLMAEKTHIEELDEQFKGFLNERDGLKRKNKDNEKKVKCLVKEKELLNCECLTMKSKIQQLQQENEKLQYNIKTITEQLEGFKKESAANQLKMKNMAEENRQTIEQILSLNEENRNLSQSIDVLRQRGQYTSICCQEEMTKLNDTIEKLQTNLERTRMTQEEEEMIHQKEISQLNETINHLENGLKVMQEKYTKDVKTCKICRGKSKVGFMETSEVQANLETGESELVKILNDTKTKMGIEIEKRNNKIQMLKDKVNELESSLNICEDRAANLQEAVTLYSNSVTVLESAKEDAKDQIQQQKITIANLQQALVEAKQEVDELRRKTQEHDIKRQGIVDMLEGALKDMDEENEIIRTQSIIINKEYDKLQDINFTLEVEHCDSLQDIDELENQLNKYRGLFKENEAQTKKLSKQKRCYEEIISYFKHEMGLMADQLNNLQELLTLSNDSAQQESSKIMNAFFEVQSLNEKLSSQLCACEQKVQLENQMNQLHEAKICELQCLIQEKEMDLTKHDQAILNIRKTLNDSVQQNEGLQDTIVELNETINQLRNSVNEYENENCKTKNSCLEFQEQIGTYCNRLAELKRNLDEKTTESLKLEMAYNNEKRALKAAQKQLQETEKLQQENQKNLINELESLKHKLTVSNGNNGKLCQECETLQKQLATLSRKDAVKDLEIKRYRKIVGDLKATMMDLNSELNKNLAQKELSASCKNASCRENVAGEDSQSPDICFSCPCEVEFYQKMVDILKNSVTDLKRKLVETAQRNKHLEDEVKQKDEKLAQVQQAKEELIEKLVQSQQNDKKIAELEREIEQLRQEVQVRSMQLNDVKRSAQEINGSKCVQLALAQEEIANLKTEMSNILNRQYNLKRENEELQNQTSQLHCNINCLNEKNKTLKDQIDQYTIRIRNLTTEKETLLRKNKELLSELRSLQAMTCSADKQQRVTADSLKQLEADIEDLKTDKEEICSESKNVIKNVRAWVTEQKRINSLIAKREQEFMESIKKLGYDKVTADSLKQLEADIEDLKTDKEEICSESKNVIKNVRAWVTEQKRINSLIAKREQEFMESIKKLGYDKETFARSNEQTPPKVPCRANKWAENPVSTSPFSLGSQGTASFYDGESPPCSPECGVNEWYSSTFRSESENDSDEDYCVNTLENLTQQMKNSNKIWIDEKKTHRDCRVTKDTKETK